MATMPRWSTAALVLIIAVISANAFSRNYEGYELLTLKPVNQYHTNFLQRLILEYSQLDFWQRPVINGTALVLVPPSLLASFKTQLNAQNMSWDVANSDIDQLIQKSPRFVDHGGMTSRFRVASRRRSDDLVDHTNYHDYPQIVTYLKNFEERYNGYAKVEALKHTTYENRTMYTLRLSSNVSMPHNYRKSIIIEAGIHAREWIAPASTLYAIDQMLQSYSKGHEPGLSMIGNYDWYFVPVTNPDGYTYTRTRRLWRRNRRVFGRDCVGADLNRNFDFHWDLSPFSTNCSINEFPGTSGFSEQESKNMRHLYLSLNSSLVAYSSVHSYGQHILIPWSHSSSAPNASNYDEILRVATDMRNAMKRVDGRFYTAGRSSSDLGYLASGTSIDWALSHNPGIYSMSFELRPSPPHGTFILNTTEIIPTGKELLTGLKVMAKEMR